MTSADATLHDHPSTAVRVQIPVTGMTCAGCQATVQRALARQAGVVDANVNLMTHIAAVTYDPALASPDTLVKAIRGTGYGATVPAPQSTAHESTAAHDHMQAEQVRSLGLKALVSSVAGIVAMVLSMPLMAAHSAGAATDPFMRWVMTVLTPALRALAPGIYAIPAPVLSYTLLGLTVVVMAWAGRQFYVSGLASIRHAAFNMNTLIAVGTGAAFLYSLVATVAPAALLRHGAAPDVYYEAVIIIIAFLLVGKTLEARAKRQASAALRMLATLRSPSATSCAATRSPSDPGSAFPPMARSRRGRAPSMSRWSRVSRSPWRVTSAIRLLGVRSTPPARFATRPPRSARRACSDASHGWSRMRRALGRRSSGSPIA
jgi:Cu+-exporting ATPase